MRSSPVASKPKREFELHGYLLVKICSPGKRISLRFFIKYPNTTPVFYANIGWKLLHSIKWVIFESLTFRISTILNNLQTSFKLLSSQVMPGTDLAEQFVLTIAK
jgi:hypothetical protein